MNIQAILIRIDDVITLWVAGEVSENAAYQEILAIIDGD